MREREREKKITTRNRTGPQVTIFCQSCIMNCRNPINCCSCNISLSLSLNLCVLLFCLSLVSFLLILFSSREERNITISFPLVLSLFISLSLSYFFISFFPTRGVKLKDIGGALQAGLTSFLRVVFELVSEKEGESKRERERESKREREKKKWGNQKMNV